MNEPIEFYIPKKMREVAPVFSHYSEEILFEEVWRDSRFDIKRKKLM